MNIFIKCYSYIKYLLQPSLPLPPLLRSLLLLSHSEREKELSRAIQNKHTLGTSEDFRDKLYQSSVTTAPLTESFLKLKHLLLNPALVDTFYRLFKKKQF